MRWKRPRSQRWKCLQRMVDQIQFSYLKRFHLSLIFRIKRWCQKQLGRLWTYFPSLKIANFLNIAPKRWCPKKLLPCERIFLSWKSPIFSTLSPRGYAKKCYHVNVFSPLEKIANLLNIAPERWWKKMLPCERIFPPWKSPTFSASPPRGDAKKMLPC